MIRPSPIFTARQNLRTSKPQLERTRASSSCGDRAGAAGGGGGGGATGRATAAGRAGAGFAAGGGAAGVTAAAGGGGGGGAGLAALAGGGAGGGGAAGAAAGFGGAAAGAGAGMVALTAERQPGEIEEIFFCRHFSASPPRMPGQVDMASERHEDRMASCCACVGCAAAGSVPAARIAIPNSQPARCNRAASPLAFIVCPFLASRPPCRRRRVSRPAKR